ncbi:PQQ-binding-like beta-propeller repeat protein [Steroidobacter cummioxidans]|uniref:outer membrane protein assembly factor BamB family protein n=1 Tax=Steroidobacter cummioxidans TaxID=1803913 RepID=UPI001379837F|nr:PQQ-binding-like beta-propeller repeat protein [Steroidobacter cummioxidans]
MIRSSSTPPHVLSVAVSALLHVHLAIFVTACSGSEGRPRSTPTEYAAGDDWPYYHGNPAGTHYSALRDINIHNVQQLKIAWVYDTQDTLGPASTIESNPLIIRGRLFFISPLGRLICLDAATGRERWTFNPRVRQPGGSEHWRRGVSYWTDGRDETIFFTFDHDLYAVDANTGHPIKNFGSHGRVYVGTRVSSPGVVYQNLIIIGGGQSNIRAFDVRTGELRWIFHTIPRPGEFGYDTWPKDAWKSAIGANNWAGMSLDEARGIVFVPLAFPQDFVGVGDGDNLFANCLLALDARTGRRLWHFQTIRHDVWDWDLPAPPTLVRVKRNGKTIDALAQTSKIGFVYVLDRVTGQSLFPLTEQKALPSDIPGVRTAMTQTEPTLPLPFVRRRITAETLTKRTPEAAQAVARQFATLRSRGLWDPPSEQGTVIFPGTSGGAEWGGGAFDPASSVLYVNAIEMPFIVKLRQKSGGGSASTLYLDSCAGCHGEKREGSPPDVPPLVRIGERLTPAQLAAKISAGGAGMPAFPMLAADPAAMSALVTFLENGTDLSVKLPTPDSPKKQAQYVIAELSKFADPDGYPAVSPPWGTLNAINIDTGQYEWRIPFGEYPELAAQGFNNTGSESYGGPIVTAGGLLFIGATSH